MTEKIQYQTSKGQWEFNHLVAPVFVEHARQHIPNYETVIEKCLNLAQQKLQADSKILDFGCATGHTLRSFYSSGFRNLYGIDVSQHMLAECPEHMAQYTCADTIPESLGTFDMIMCNWTLQFSTNKQQLLDCIVNSLNPQGILVISEKISEDPVWTDLYHKWKFSQGVDWPAIDQKARSLAGVMNINSQTWWLETLQHLGLTQIHIIDASWCFSSYACVKC